MSNYVNCRHGVMLGIAATSSNPSGNWCYQCFPKEVIKNMQYKRIGKSGQIVRNGEIKLTQYDTLCLRHKEPVLMKQAIVDDLKHKVFVYYQVCGSCGQTVMEGSIPLDTFDEH